MPSSPPVTYRIRKAAVADLAALMQLENASFSSDLISHRRMRHWISASNGFLLVAEASVKSAAATHKSIAGYCLIFTRRNSGVARAYSLAIAKDARGQGLGKRLLQQAERLCRQAGFTAMQLEVAKSNLVAVRLYEKLRYSCCESIAEYYENGEDAWRMRKTL